MSTTLQHALTSARTLLICGTGGVGKTTTSVVVGLAAAQLGRRTLVLTVDPARRLANVLGLAAFDHDIHRVWEHTPRNAEPTRAGSLDCMMLDAKRTFDRVIERYAPDADSAKKILHNPLYQQLSTMIAGSQEYMAMEQLYDLMQSTDYDLIILDTPPMHQALDFFRAPLRMVNAVSGSMLKLFLKPTLMASKWGAALLSRGTDKLLRMFGRLTGAEMLHEISELIMSAVGLLGGFKERAEAVQAMLRAENAGLIIVTVPQRELILDAQHFLAEVETLGMQIRGIILNRTTPMFGKFPPHQSLPAGLRDLAAQCEQRRAIEQQLTRTLAKNTPRCPLHCIMERVQPPTTLQELLSVAEELSTGVSSIK